MTYKYLLETTLEQPYNTPELLERVDLKPSYVIEDVIKHIIQSLNPDKTTAAYVQQMNALQKFEGVIEGLGKKHDSGCLIVDDSKRENLNERLKSYGERAAAGNRDMSYRWYAGDYRTSKCILIPWTPCPYIVIPYCRQVQEARMEVFKHVFPSHGGAKSSGSYDLETPLLLLFWHLISYESYKEVTDKDGVLMTHFSLLLEKLIRGLQFEHHYNHPSEKSNQLYNLRELMRSSPVVQKVIDLYVGAAVDVSRWLSAHQALISRFPLTSVEKKWSKLLSLAILTHEIRNWSDDEVFCGHD